MSLGPQLPDFDLLVALHQHDPEAFESFRRHLLRQAVDCAPLAQRPVLEQTLLRIEEVRSEAKTPMEATLAASRMMHESVHQLNDAWQDARHAVAELQTALVIERLRGRAA